jgi:polyribonucleotide nucleotidyltransferase
MPILPAKDIFSSAIHIESEVLASGGSSSMGSVCASSLALIDAGIPVTSLVSGIAMGLIIENDKVAVLSDIQSIEDEFGDMDFKVAGTLKGITALQMDNKIAGLSSTILAQTIMQAKDGRLHILNEMTKTQDNFDSQI